MAADEEPVVEPSGTFFLCNKKVRRPTHRCLGVPCPPPPPRDTWVPPPPPWDIWVLKVLLEGGSPNFAAAPGSWVPPTSSWRR